MSKHRTDGLCPKCGKREKDEGYGGTYCRICYRKYKKKYQHIYRATPNGKAKTLKAVKRYEARNPDRKKAWNKRSKIPRGKCVVCGRGDTVRHHEDISKPYDVVILCQLHHREVHKVGLEKLMNMVK